MLLPTVILILLAALWRRLFWLLQNPKCDYRTHSARIPANALNGKVCWVTGASSGIGAALARALAAHGGFVVLTARREDALRAIAEELPSGRSFVLVADLAQESASSLQRLAERAASAFDASNPRIDYLFNNAGVSSRAIADGFDPENIEHMMRLNFLAPVILTQACLPALRASHGAVVNTSSIASIICTPLRSGYCSSKAALSRWHECLRMEELEESSFSVVNVCPGSVRTSLAHNALTRSKGERFGTEDINIENGLDASYTADRILAAACSRLQEAWIARGKELLVTYMAYYTPALWSYVMPTMVKSYVESITNMKSLRKEH